MKLPWLVRTLVRYLADEGRAEDVLGDLAEAHRRRLGTQGALSARLLTYLEALDMARVLLAHRLRSATPRFSLLDFKLGARMLARYPGLTLVGGLAMAFGITIASAGFEAVTQLAFPTLPLEDGDRLVAIQLRDVATGDNELQIVRDFVEWREELTSVEELSAFSGTVKNLVSGGGEPEPVSVTPITASGFATARTPPLLGRALTPADDEVGAPPVLVIGYDEWQIRFDADPDIIGKTVSLGGQPTTVVGVMPEHFAFPSGGRFWAPLPIDVLDHERGSGPSIMVLGRLAPAATLESAQAELTTLGRRVSSDFPATHAQLRPFVMPYSDVLFGGWPGFFSPEYMLSNVFLVALVVLLCGNVALLMFARAAARESELIVRSALGAGRGRLVTQLFTEALVLGGIAAAVGIFAGHQLWQWGLTAHAAELPFWFRDSISLTNVLYCIALAVVAAAVAGVLPGLKATRSLGERLKEGTAGGGGMRFGGVWTTVIVMQIAVTVAFPAVALFLQQEAGEKAALGVDVDLTRYAAARLDATADVRSAGSAVGAAAAFADRYAASLTEIARRVGLDPDVTAMTFVDNLPREYHGWNQIEVDEGAIEPIDQRGHRVARVNAEAGFFEVFGAPVTAGRGFDSRDAETGAPVVIVDQLFVERVLGGKSPIGRLVRYVATQEDPEPRTDGPWFEIIGVVPYLGARSGYRNGGIYHVAKRGDVYPTHLVLQARTDPGPLLTEVRRTASAVDPELLVRNAKTLDSTLEGDLGVYEYWTRLSSVLSGLALLLSLAGIYSVMAFTVTRKTREIGIRVALGAHRRRIVLTILRRPLLQVIVGIALGAAFIGLMVEGGISTAEGLSTRELGSIMAYAALMTAVCMLACILPTRRALGVEPTEALGVEG